HKISEQDLKKILGIKGKKRLECLLFTHLDTFSLDELVIYLAYQSPSQPNLLTNSAQLTQLEQERNHYQTLYQKRVKKDLAHDQSAKIQQLTHQIKQLENNLAGANEVKTLYQQKASDLETSLLALGKSKTLQEYLEWKYPTQEDKEGAEEINIREINKVRKKAGITKKLEEGELDLREFKNLKQAVFYEDYSGVALLISKLNVEGLINLTNLSCHNNNLTSLDVSQNVNLITLKCYGNNLTSLDVSQNVNLTKLSCSSNKLTSVDFLKQLPHPEKLLELDLANNNIEPTNLEFLRPFVNLTEKLTLEPLRNMTKLPGLCIDGTDVEEGIEYLPVSISKDNFNCSPKLPNQKVAKIQNELRPFNYDLEA
ncbi:11391_t:CDS:2, partial [Funneliformis geosporum]